MTLQQKMFTFILMVILPQILAFILLSGCTTPNTRVCTEEFDGVMYVRTCDNGPMDDGRYDK